MGYLGGGAYEDGAVLRLRAVLVAPTDRCTEVSRAKCSDEASLAEAVLHSFLLVHDHHYEREISSNMEIHPNV